MVDIAPYRWWLYRICHTLENLVSLTKGFTGVHPPLSFARYVYDEGGTRWRSEIPNFSLQDTELYFKLPIQSRPTKYRRRTEPSFNLDKPYTSPFQMFYPYESHIMNKLKWQTKLRNVGGILSVFHHDNRVNMSFTMTSNTSNVLSSLSLGTKFGFIDVPVTRKIRERRSKGEQGFPPIYTGDSLWHGEKKGRWD